MNKITVFSDTFYPSKSVSSFRIKGFVDALSEEYLLDIYTSQQDAVHHSSNVNFITNKHISHKAFKLFFYMFSTLFIILKSFGEKNKIILMTGSPFFYFLLAPIYRVFQYKVILDFRDPWFLRPEIKPSWYIKHFEKIAIKFSTISIFVNCIVKDSYSTYYEKYYNKFFVIENGYFDYELPKENIESILIDYKIDFQKLSNYNNIFVYAGKFSYRKYQNLFEALKSHQTSLFLKIGDDEPEFQAFVAENCIENIDFVRQMTQVEYFSLAKAFNMINVVITSEYPWEASTKVFDSFVTKNRILAITPKNSYVDNLVSKNNLGVTCRNDLNNLNNAIYDVLDFSSDIEGNRDYLRTNLSRKLIELLNHEI